MATFQRVRRDRGLTLQTVADSLECDLSTVWKWLRKNKAKRSRPDPIVRIAIERLYGIAADSWLTTEERRAMARATGLDATGTEG